MARLCLDIRNQKRKKLINKFQDKRQKLKAIIKNKNGVDDITRFQAVLDLASLPRNSSSTRYRLRCHLSGRPRGNYRKFEMSRNKFRELASQGYIPGVRKASW